MPDFKTMLGSSPKLFTKLVSISSSGVSRSFDCYLIYEGEIVNVNHEVAAYTSKRRNSMGSVIIREREMSMTFLTYGLSKLIYEGDGHKLKHVAL